MRLKSLLLLPFLCTSNVNAAAITCTANGQYDLMVTQEGLLTLNHRLSGWFISGQTVRSGKQGVTSYYIQWSNRDFITINQYYTANRIDLCPSNGTCLSCI
jgi:hypothetical protein